MKAVHVVRVVLLVLVSASVGAWGWRVWRAARAAPEAPATNAAAATPIAAIPITADPLLAEGVAVVNFHGALRCPTCHTIGALSKAVVEEEFADDVSAGRVQWSSIDFEDAAYAHYTDDYELSSSNVVVVRRSGGKDVGYRRLDDVWTHYDDEPTFRAYVAAAVRDALAGR
ncbi:MAG: nitrophenyl compound nitroreductase subunit ArsF family protein [Planctomycetes bacterium]|nr:nitrophenyl compound nitroreductase subunit ArsF family protein [Planctomycetota bacterium]